MKINLRNKRPIRGFTLTELVGAIGWMSAALVFLFFLVCLMIWVGRHTFN